MNKLECMLSGNGSRKCEERKGKRKRKKKRNTGMMMMMMMTRMVMIRITHPRTIMMTAKLTPSSVDQCTYVGFYDKISRKCISYSRALCLIIYS